MLKSRNFARGKSRGRVSGGSGLSPLAPVILGPVPRILLQRVPNLVNKLALLLHKYWLREDSWDKPKNDWCRGRGFGTFSQSGRSMIEMLGVLAIIGVLSVGGIAGYSKATMKWKINKAVEEYNFLIQGLMEYKDNLVKSNPEVGQVKLGEFIKAANLVPDTWTTSDGLFMTDSMGNGNAPYLNNQGHMIVIDIYFAKYQNSQAAEYSYRFCEALFMDIAYPLASELHGIFLYGSGYTTITFRGTKSCEKADGFKCLQDLTLADVNKECRACIAGDSGQCGAVIVF